jgi:mycothiol synthase
VHVDELRIRAATLGDTEQLAAFLTRCAVTYLGRPSPRQEAVERLTVSGGAPEASALVAVMPDGRVVGFGNVWVAGQIGIKCFARVDPTMTGRGVGTTLLERLEGRARELAASMAGPLVLTATQWAQDTAGPGLFISRGYSEVRFFLRMIADDLDGIDEDKVQVPPGVALRPFRPSDDDEDLYDAWRQAFADEWDQAEIGAEQWWRERRELKTATFDPSIWFVAVAERIVGFVIAREELKSDGRVGYISDIGVRPGWRGMGLGYALLVHSFAEMHRRGLGSAALNVDADNRTSALRLYKKAGMRELPHFTIWGKQLD